MKKALLVSGAVVAVLLCIGFVILYSIGQLVTLPELPQPTFGYAGEWRRDYPFGWQEAQLPPAAEVWSHHEQWSPGTNDFAMRIYVARLGHAERQLNFRASTNMTKNMPLGDYYYTSVEFDYVDPTNGIYHFTWRLRGKHDVTFLRFDTTERLFHLQLYGSRAEFPPMLAIEAIEGIRPWEN